MGGWVGTLLGPEETDPLNSPSCSCVEGGWGWFLLVPGLLAFSDVGWGCGWCWLLFENCTVDASIS
jgi:hypothetical protein